MLKKIGVAAAMACLLWSPGALAGKPGSCLDKVSAGSVSLSPALPVEGQAVTVSGKIQNLTKKSLSVPWTIMDETAAVLGRGAETIAGGGTATVSAQWTPRVGSHAVKLVADPSGTLGETGSCVANNGSSVTVTVACLDRVAAVEVKAPPGQPKPGDRVEIAATIGNLVTFDLPSVSWLLKEEHGITFAKGTVSVPAGGRVPVSGYWIAEVGQHVFTLVVDPLSSLETGSCTANNSAFVEYTLVE